MRMARCTGSQISASRPPYFSAPLRLPLLQMRLQPLSHWRLFHSPFHTATVTAIATATATATAIVIATAIVSVAVTEAVTETETVVVAVALSRPDIGCAVFVGFAENFEPRLDSAAGYWYLFAAGAAGAAEAGAVAAPAAADTVACTAVDVVACAAAVASLDWKRVVDTVG